MDSSKPLFAKQSELPSLPVPDLDATATKLLSSMRALATSDDEFRHSEAVVKDFVSGLGRDLQIVLADRAREHRSEMEVVIGCSHHDFKI
jgi:hypothetical protein